MALTCPRRDNKFALVKPLILVIAHKPPTFLMLAQALLKFGCEMITAHPDPVELDRAKGQSPWLVLLRPPVESVQQRRCLELVKERFPKRETPILACVRTEEERQTVHEHLGAVQVLVGSPLHLTELYARMQEMLHMVRRAVLRIRTELVVAHREPNLYKDDFFFYDRMMSLSMCGCFIQTKSPYPIGSEVELIFCLGGKTGNYHLTGRVRRHGTDVDGHEGMGVSFEDLSDETRSGLKSYLLAQLTNLDFPSAL